MQLLIGHSRYIHMYKLTFIYSLDTLWYSVRNLDVTWFFISSISAGLRTCILVWHRSIWGRMPFLTPPQSAGNRTRDLSNERAMLCPLHHGHSLSLTQINEILLLGTDWVWDNKYLSNRNTDCLSVYIDMEPFKFTWWLHLVSIWI